MNRREFRDRQDEIIHAYLASDITGAEHDEALRKLCEEKKRAEKSGGDAMKYKLVQMVDGRMIVSQFAAENFLAAMEVRGFKHDGYLHEAYRRAELHGEPKFIGLLGPMWDGEGIIRYEDRESYEALSI